MNEDLTKLVKDGLPWEPELRAFIGRTTRYYPHLADDVYQEVLVTLWNSDGFEDAEHIKAYSFKVARYTAYRMSKDEQARREREKVYAQTTQPAGAEPQHDPSEEIHNHLLLDELLETLTPRQRTAVEMVYLDGYSYSEAADALSCSKQAVQQLVTRAIAALGRKA